MLCLVQKIAIIVPSSGKYLNSLRK